MYPVIIAIAVHLTVVSGPWALWHVLPDGRHALVAGGAEADCLDRQQELVGLTGDDWYCAPVEVQ